MSIICRILGIFGILLYNMRFLAGFFGYANIGKDQMNGMIEEVYNL